MIDDGQSDEGQGHAEKIEERGEASWSASLTRTKVAPRPLLQPVAGYGEGGWAETTEQLFFFLFFGCDDAGVALYAGDTDAA